MRALVVIVALFLGPITAYADQPLSMIGSAFKRPPGDALILLLPPSAEAVELEPGIPMLLQALHSELSAAGFRAALLDKANYETVWAQEVEAVGGIFDSATGAVKARQRVAAMAALARRLTRETSASLVLMPRLLTRKADLHGTKAAWDGRLMRVPTRGTFGGAPYSSGTTTAVSVQLVALTQNGDLAFSTYGGVTLPYIINFVTEKPEMRANVFSDEADLAEGVKIALTPLGGK